MSNYDNTVTWSKNDCLPEENQKITYRDYFGNQLDGTFIAGNKRNFVINECDIKIDWRDVVEWSEA